MAIVQMSVAPGRDEYETVAKRLDMGTDPPAGLIVHTAAELPSGEVQIVDVWESLEQLQAFAEQRLFPAFAEAGVMEQVQSRGAPASYETFDIVRG